MDTSPTSSPDRERPSTSSHLLTTSPPSNSLEYSLDDSGLLPEGFNPNMSVVTNEDGSLASSQTYNSERRRKRKPNPKTPNDLRMTRPGGMSPQHAFTNFPQFFSGPSLLEHEANKFPVGSGMSAAENLSSPSQKKKKKKKKKTGNVFQRDSPNAKKNLRSFLVNFTDERNFSIMDKIDLHQHSLDTGVEITNATVQEVCAMKPDMTSLNLSQCSAVTDVGLWAIARCCSNIKELTLSECGGITNIGLRSLAMKCTGIQRLDFSKCPNLDDAALRVIAAGMWGLQHFVLTGCNNITDNGVAEVARCCHHLEFLDVSECNNVGEYGDKALMEVGKYCHKLTTLNMFGCKHVGTAGVKAVAQGCRELKELRLTGCRELGSEAIKSLAQHCTQLQDLSIANCQKVENKDIAKLARHCKMLQKLDISECSNISAKGLKVLAQECNELSAMNLRGCTSVDDEALRVLADGCVGLRDLDISGCQRVSEVGITNIAHGCTGIGYLNVTDCKLISRRFLMRLINDMQFSDPAHTYFGYQPKPDADELRRKAQELQEMGLAATDIQRVIRGTLARGGVKEIKRAHIIKYQLPKAQAWVRGFLRRRKWQKVLRKRLEHWAASHIRASWRGLQDRRFVKKMLAVKSKYDLREEKSVDIQRLIRGHWGRKAMQAVRDEVARLQLAQAQVRARRERAATAIQRTRRGFASRLITEEMRAERERMRALEKLRIKCARKIQRVMRGMFGRNIARAARAAKELFELQWVMARKLQAAWRGKLGRDKARTLRDFKEYQLMTHSAILIQKTWKGYRGKYMGKVAASLAGLRNLEVIAARKIQSCFRARQGREAAKAKRDLMAHTLMRMRAVQVCQRVFRGHKGREKSAVQRALKGLEHKAIPLYNKLSKEKGELEIVKEKITALTEVLHPREKDTQELRKEITLIARSKAKFWDSERISGAPQRFMTDWLREKLQEKIQDAESVVLELRDQLGELQIKEREKLRHIRHISRELVPLTTGTIEKTKIERTNYLRHKVRVEKAASTDIQKCFRGFWVRCAVHGADRDFWVEDYDTTTGQNLYFNSWTNETRWRKPLGMKLAEEFNLAVKQGKTGGDDLRKAGGWIEMIDHQKNLTYFYNNSSQAYRWTEPAEFEDPATETNSDWYDAQDEGSLIGNSGPTGKDVGFWNEMCEAEVGEIFYTHKMTGEIRWSLSPRSAFDKRGAIAAAGASVEGGEGGEGEDEEEEIVIGEWRRVVDSSGVFYINDVMEESQWDPPQEFLDAGYE
ncbi:hypothetical protein TrVE_jg13687 [Triparma verrucosa]|uniref:WW domain-containing protein n=1 Tax=Triparma verrucosa TaxID=1606542 RepID=A0A9W7C0K1_9STRA|nr:hypothetical protein TrVE_jg13687 [Triparma verrucosa]